jgi:hypothetical protein
MTAGWLPVEHACRTCLGRIAERDGTFRCLTCGIETARGLKTPMTICGCGIGAEGATHRRGGFRCAPNPFRGPATPAEIIVLFGDVPAIEK